MKSRWFHLKEKVVSLRQKGFSIRDVESKFGIPRSTLSGWFKNIKLSKKHEKALKLRWENALVEAREKAVIWHNKQKELRLLKAEQEAETILSRINVYDKNIIELGLAMLYLGEGAKNACTAIGNSNPLILKFFLSIMQKMYGLEINNMRFDLHLRYDQDPLKMKKYWANQLKIPIKRIKGIAIDRRTKGKKTYDNYKGVCVVDCASVAIQRKLVYLSNKFCNKIIENLE